MTTLPEKKHVFQAMFLLDNQEVRAQGFNAIRDWVKSILEKHGLDVKVLRLWGERPLAYPIAGRRRATYLLGWLEGTGTAVAAAKRDFYLVGPVFRLLFLHEEGIPADEMEFGIQQMDDKDLVIPEDEPEVVEEEESEVEEAAGEAESKDADKKEADKKEADKKEGEGESKPEAAAEGKSPETAETTEAKA
ncbi:MAG: hypothetical protein DWQ01_21850 [Planctomycetota bacterium]|nr:MAG: hypothetical protein DWQ01_21850 [Planctomycetota bacterium]